MARATSVGEGVGVVGHGLASGRRPRQSGLMPYETILFEIKDGAARLTLNRPDRLNSFTLQMHEEVADALAKVEAKDSGVRVLLLTGAGRGFCAGQDLADRAVAPGGACRRSRGVGGEALQSADPPPGHPADAGGLRRQRGGGGRRGEYRAGLRHRHRCALGQVHRELRQHRPDPRQRRHLAPCPPRRPGPRARHGAHRRADPGRDGRSLGPDLEVRRRRRPGRARPTLCSPALRLARRAASRRPSAPSAAPGCARSARRWTTSAT